MPLDLSTGRFICPACDVSYGLLDPDAPVGAQDAPAEFICTDCAGAASAATADSMTNPSDGHRHSAIDAAQVAAFYAGAPAGAAPAAADTATAEAALQAATGATPEQTAPAQDDEAAAADADLPAFAQHQQPDQAGGPSDAASAGEQLGDIQGGTAALAQQQTEGGQ